MKRVGILHSLCCVAATVCQAQTADVRVDLSQPGKKVDPGEFGNFPETRPKSVAALDQRRQGVDSFRYKSRQPTHSKRNRAD